MADEGLGKLIAYLGIDTAALEAGQARAEKSLGDLDKKMEATAATAGKVAGTMVVAFAAAATVMVHRTLEAMDAQKDMAATLGLSVESLQELTFAGKQAGLSQEDLAGVVNKLNRNIQMAASGTPEQAQAFKDLGVSATDAGGNLRGADDVLMDIADKFQKMPDGAAKSAMAMDLLGKSGAKMIPLLNDGSEGLKQQIALAHQLGFVFDSKTAAAADHFNDTLDVLSMAGTGFANRLTAELLPTLTNVGDTLLDVAKDSGTMETASGALSTMLKGLVIIGLTVGATFADIGGWIGALAAAAVQAVQGNFSDAMTIMRERSADSAADMDKLGSRISKVWNGVADEAMEATFKEQAALLRATEAQKKAAKEAEEAAKRKQKANADTVKSLQEEAATLGMTAGQAAIFKLQMDGATATQIRAAEAARRVIDQFAALKELGSIKIGAMDSNDAAVAQLQEKYARLNEIVAANPQLQQQAAEAAAMLAQQYQNSVDAQIAQGQAGNQAFLDQMTQRIEQIKAQNATEIELELQKHQLDQEMLEQSLLNGVITEEQYRDINLQNEKAHEDKMRAMKIKSWDDLKNLSKLSWQAQLSTVTGTLTEMTAALSTKSRTMFEINKRAAEAQVVMKGIESVQSAYAAGNAVGGPYVGAAFAAVAAAFSATQLSAIESTTYGSGANSTTSGIPSAATSVPTNAPAASSAPSQSGTLAVTGIGADTLLDGKTVRAIAERLLQFQADGGKVVFEP